MANYYRELLPSLFSYLKRLFGKEDKLELILQTVGLSVLLYFSSLFVFQLFRWLRRNIPRDILKRYGPGSWVLVTGASDGIGKAYCEEFAERGFNVILLARNLEKLKNVELELKLINGKIQTKIIVAELENANDLGFFERIVREIEGLDISILVNDAGTANFESFGDCEEKHLMDLIKINVITPTMLMKKLLKRLQNRNYRSGIINMSSMTMLSSSPSLAAYSSTKSYLDYLTKNLALQFDNIDFLAVRPYYVSTKLVGYRKNPFDTISPLECTRGVVNDLGRTNITYAHWKHDIMHGVIAGTPEFMRNVYIKNFVAASKPKVT